MKNKIEDMRNHLFAAIEGLMDDEKPMDIARAKAVAEMAQTIINSAKVEVEYLRVTNAKQGSGFIPLAPRDPKPLGSDKGSET